MKKFIRNTVLLLIIVSVFMTMVVMFDYFIVGSQYNESYQASIIDKTKRLTTIEGPKIILVGNSNLAFGINSELIQNEFGMPVVNLGSHGNYGNAFNEEIAKLNIGNGDIVILCHTNYSDDDEISDRELAWTTYDWHSELFPIFRKEDYFDMIIAYPHYFTDAFRLWITGKENKDSGTCYSRSAFNEYGDVVYKPQDIQADVDKLFSKSVVKLPEINDICVNRINSFNEYCKENGATLLVAAYPIAYGKYSQFDEADFEEFQNQLGSRLECDVISDFKDYFYPYDYFYDTIFHLTNDAAIIRTNQLIDDLNKWMDSVE